MPIEEFKLVVSTLELDKRDVQGDSAVINKNEFILLPNLTFEGGVHYFEKQAYPDLEKLKTFMLNNPTVNIEIQGHICCRRNGEDGFDPETYREDLSVQRARQVYLHLIEGGISKDRMNYVGFGSSRKIILNDFGDVEAARINRRVEIQIISK